MKIVQRKIFLENVFDLKNSKKTIASLKKEHIIDDVIDGHPAIFTDEGTQLGDWDSVILFGNKNEKYIIPRSLYFHSYEIAKKKSYLAKSLEKYRKKNHIKLFDMAKSLKVSSGFLSSVENNDILLSKDFLQKIISLYPDLEFLEKFYEKHLKSNLLFSAKQIEKLQNLAPMSENMYITHSQFISNYNINDCFAGFSITYNDYYQKYDFGYRKTYSCYKFLIQNNKKERISIDIDKKPVIIKKELNSFEEVLDMMKKLNLEYAAEIKKLI